MSGARKSELREQAGGSPGSGPPSPAPPALGEPRSLRALHSEPASGACGHGASCVPPQPRTPCAYPAAAPRRALCAPCPIAAGRGGARQVGAHGSPAPEDVTREKPRRRVRKKPNQILLVI